MSPADNNGKPPNFAQAIASVLSAAFGVQSSKNRERDFQQGNPALFIGAGVLATILFILTIYGVVKLVLG